MAPAVLGRQAMTMRKQASGTGAITAGPDRLTGKLRRKAVQAGPVLTGPVSSVSPQPEARKELRTLHPEGVPRFLRACRGRRLNALGVVALDSGARLGELLALEW